MTPPAPGDLVLCIDGLGRCQESEVVIVRNDTLVCRALPAGIGCTAGIQHEGLSWVRGHAGEIPDAFRAQVALVGNTAPAVWVRQSGGGWLCVAAGAGGALGDRRLGS